MATAKELLAVAVRQLNVREDPPGSNNVRYNTWYYGREVSGKAYPWCMAFVQWCFDQAGVKLPARTAACGTPMNAGKSFRVRGTGDFQPGDVAIYDFSGKRRTTEHCGIVEAVLPGYGVQAIEGNTSESGSQSNGGMVCRKTRPWKYIVGAVRPDFTEEDDMTGEEIYNKLNDYLRDKPAPAWAQAELAEAVALGITDGKNPMQLIPRYQAAIMAKRAAQR